VACSLQLLLCNLLSKCAAVIYLPASTQYGCYVACETSCPGNVPAAVAPSPEGQMLAAHCTMNSAASGSLCGLAGITSQHTWKPSTSYPSTYLFCGRLSVMFKADNHSCVLNALLELTGALQSAAHSSDSTVFAAVSATSQHALYNSPHSFQS
jgi:hypothetical protein